MVEREAADGKTYTQNSVYAAGRNAWRAGDPVNTCPHSVGSRERVTWRAAWWDANNKAVAET